MPLPVRKSIVDVWWNAFMTQDANFSLSQYDIPLCPTTACSRPKSIITFKQAKEIYSYENRKGNVSFVNPAFVCFYDDDKNFDTQNGIWFKPQKAYNVLQHFAGIITPDFSTNQDFPCSLKIWNTYRIRAFGYWYGKLCGGKVINNVRWGTPETYCYCFDGIPFNSVVAIGTVGGSPKKLVDRSRFEDGLKEMVKRLNPHTIIVYGSANYPCFDKLRKQGIDIHSYPSKTALAFERRKSL